MTKCACTKKTISVEDILKQASEADSCLMKNSKTCRSVDFTTLCGKLLAGNECSYCYVQTARSHGFNAKKYYTEIHYNGEILRMTKTTINKLNAGGGLRTFSFADYLPWMDSDIIPMAKDAKMKGLKLKAITKVPAFVKKFHNLFDIIHVSVDNLGEGVNWETAKALREEFPNVLIRSVIVKNEDVEALSWTDILTLNHGNNGYKNYSQGKQNKADAKDITAKYANKVCCQTGKCHTCPVKCGQAVVEARKAGN